MVLDVPGTLGISQASIAAVDLSFARRAPSRVEFALDAGPKFEIVPSRLSCGVDGNGNVRADFALKPVRRGRDVIEARDRADRKRLSEFSQQISTGANSEIHAIALSGELEVLMATYPDRAAAAQYDPERPEMPRGTLNSIFYNAKFSIFSIGKISEILSSL